MKMTTDYLYQLLCSHLTEKEEYALDVLLNVQGFNNDTIDNFIYAVFGYQDILQYLDAMGYDETSINEMEN